MASELRNIVVKWFLQKLKPTEAQFLATWNAVRFKDEKIKLEDIEGLQQLIDEQADAELVESLEKEVKKGFKNAPVIQLQTNTPKEYKLPENAMFFALEIKSPAMVSIGTTENTIDDLGDINETSEAILQTGFINASSIWMQANTNVEVQPIIYQK